MRSAGIKTFFLQFSKVKSTIRPLLVNKPFPSYKNKCEPWRFSNSPPTHFPPHFDSYRPFSA